MKRVILAGIIAGLLLAGAVIPVAFQSEHGFERITLTATGSAGAASGTVTTSTRFWGRIEAVHIDYTADISSTTDVTLARVSPAGNVLVVTDNATDGWYYPAAQLHDSAATPVAAYEQTPVNDRLTIAAAQSTSGTVAVLTIYYGQ